MACIAPITIPDKFLASQGLKGAKITVPCGHCVGCAHDRVNDWYVRLHTVHHEYAVVKKQPVWFFTASINPKLWPGMVKSSPGVRDRVTPFVRSWNERLRYLNGGKMPLRFMCSEFGSEGREYISQNGRHRITTGALHFHGLLFGYLPLAKIKSGFEQTHGWIDISRVESEACVRYTVKYATKDYSQKDPLLRSRTFCSPGLGDPSFYFGDGVPTRTVLINGYHYRTPRYLIDQQWINIYGGRNKYFDEFGHSRLVWLNGIKRVEQGLAVDGAFEAALRGGYYDWYLSQYFSKHKPVPTYNYVLKLCELKRVGPGHPLLRQRELNDSDRVWRSTLLEDHSFDTPPKPFVNQFYLTDYERHQTQLSLSLDFET